MSKPPQPESSGESFKVQNAQTTIFLGHATFSPVYFAFPSRECHVACPEELFSCFVKLV